MLQRNLNIGEKGVKKMWKVCRIRKVVDGMQQKLPEETN